MINPLWKIAFSALGSMVIAIPAVAADLIPYNNGYIPDQHFPASRGPYAYYPGYDPNGYGAERRYCDLNGNAATEAPDGLPRPCAPVGTYPAAILPTGPDPYYSYQRGYGPRPPEAIGPNDHYSNYSYQPGYRPPLAIAPNDRYGDHSYQRGYESDHPPSGDSPQ